MKLSIGDLVRLSPIAGGTADLGVLPTDPHNAYSKIVAVWGSNDVGIVVALDRSDGRNACVTGNAGTGWLPGAYLELIK